MEKSSMPVKALNSAISVLHQDDFAAVPAVFECVDHLLVILISARFFFNDDLRLFLGITDYSSDYALGGLDGLRHARRAVDASHHSGDAQGDLALIGFRGACGHRCDGAGAFLTGQ
jgi:hypothetical protein